MSSLSRAGSLGTSLLSQSHSEATAEAMGFFGVPHATQGFSARLCHQTGRILQRIDGVNRDDLHGISLGMDLFICKEK